MSVQPGIKSSLFRGFTQISYCVYWMLATRGKRHKEK